MVCLTVKQCTVLMNVLSVVLSSVAGDGVVIPSVSPLSVLILTPDATGHFTPLLALGESLMERGYSVSVATERTYKGAWRLQRMCSDRKMSFHGYGSEIVEYERDEMLRRMVEAGHSVPYMLSVLLPMFARAQEVLINALKTDIHLLKGTDVAVVDFILPAVTLWLNTNTNLTVISYSQSFSYGVNNVPLWHFPVHIGGVYPAFLGRFFGAAVSGAINAYLHTVGCHYKQYFPTHTPAGVYNPEVAGVVFGFDYPRPLYPMTHYVGPVVSKKEEVLLDELHVWLDRHSPKSVLYISMGSMFTISKELAITVMDAAVRSNYDILWTMKDSNRHVLDLDQELLQNGSIFISSWLPQATVLRHPSISVAILHCGLGGVNEALMAGVPIIGSPIALDQFGNCARVHNQGLGVCLHGAEKITSDLLHHSIREIERGSYRETIRKLNVIFKEAGGVERAADLIEHYHEVGYGHLTPFWAKHEWSTVQYYNLDVYAVIAGVVMLVVFTLYKCSRCVCNSVCCKERSMSRNCKTKED